MAGTSRAPRPISNRALARLVYVAGTCGGPYRVITSGLTAASIDVESYRTALFLMHALRRYVSDVLSPAEQHDAFLLSCRRRVGIA